MPVKVEPTPPLPGLSPAAGKSIIARFDGGQLSSDAGVLALREVERRLGIAERLAACIEDPRPAGPGPPAGGRAPPPPLLIDPAGYTARHQAASLTTGPRLQTAAVD